MDESSGLPAGLEVEYTALRAEITQRIGLRQQLLSITLTFAAVIFGFGVDDGTVALIYPPLAAFLALAWVQNDKRVHDAAVYVRDYLEPRFAALGWETSIQQGREQSGDSTWRLTILSHGGLFVGTQLIAVAIGLIQFDSTALDYTLLGISAPSLLVALLAFRGAGR